MYCLGTTKNTPCTNYPEAHGLGTWVYYQADLELIGGKFLRPHQPLEQPSAIQGELQP
jgi:hypothetical protein